MVKPLSFKGDKKSSGGSSKKRKRPEVDVEDKFSSSSAAAADTRLTARETEDVEQAIPEDELSWVSAEATTDIAGPILMVLPTTPPSCLACDANGKIFASTLENLVSSDPTTAEPHDVRQVWVANRVAGTESISFKGHHGRYLGADKFGIITAKKEAISPEESFMAIPAPETPGAFALQASRDTFVTIDHDHDDDNSTKKITDTQVRADADAISFNTTFRIRMQARFKPKLKASKAEKALEKISRQELEEAVGRRLEDHEVKTLKKARRQGNYHEALLDIKVKGKHDKFA